jgi:hypothetical protein
LLYVKIIHDVFHHPLYKSPSQVGCDTFGIGEMHESFQAAGNVPEVRDVLKIVATGSANS